MDTTKGTGDAGAVIPLDDNRNLVLKMHDARIHNGQAESARELQAEMFIFGVAFKFAGRRFENMCRGNAAGRHAPFLVLEEQGRFRLGARQAELAGIAGSAPSGLVFTQGSQALGDFFFVEPFDGRSGRTQNGVEPCRLDKLHSSSTIFADVGDQAEGVPRGDMEFARPVTEDDFVVWQKTPQERVNLGVGVFG